MFSKDILNEVSNEGGLNKKKTSIEIGQETLTSKLNQLIEENKYIQDSLLKVKESINKGKNYKFVIGRDESGLIKEISALPLGE